MGNHSAVLGDTLRIDAIGPEGGTDDDLIQLSAGQVDVDGDLGVSNSINSDNEADAYQIAGVTILSTKSQVDVSGTNNIFLGVNAGTDNTIGSDNMAIGTLALTNNTEGLDNVAIGSSSMFFNTTGDQNVGLGAGSCSGNTTGSRNIGIGFQANRFNQTGDDNICIGQNAGEGTSGSSFNNCLYIGRSAGIAATTGIKNTVVGSLSATSLSSGANNTVVGQGAATALSIGSDNVVIGYRAGRAIAGDSNSVFVGAYAGRYETAGSALYIDGLDRGNEADGKLESLLYGVFNSNPASQTLRVNAITNITQKLRIGDTTAPTYALEVAGVTKTESGRIPKTTRLTADGTTLGTTQHEVFCDTDGGAFTVTLPATPVGQTYRITNSGNNNLTVGRNGNTIKGSATDATIPSGDTLILTWEPTEGWW
jgi:hypothetical protein